MTDPVPSKELLCGHCQLPIHPSDSRRHFGFYVAHGDGRCVQLLQMEIERLQAALRGIQSCSTCEACRGAATLALGGAAPEPPAESQSLRDARFAIGALVAAAGGRVAIRPSVLVNMDPRSEIETFDDPVSGARIFTLRTPQPPGAGQ